jgi:hypothetical protein
MPFRLYKLIFYSANLSFNLFRRTCINLQSLIDFSSLETKLVKNVSLCKWKLERNLLFWYDCPVIRKGLFQRLCLFATKAHKRSLLKELFLFFKLLSRDSYLSTRGKEQLSKSDFRGFCWFTDFRWKQICEHLPSSQSITRDLWP